MAFTYCENCGEKIDDNGKFCPHCGHSKNGAQGAHQSTPNGGAYTDGCSSNGQNPYGNGQNQYGGQSPYGNQGGYGNQNPYGQNPYGQNPYGNGQNQYGQNPYGQNPYGNGQQQPPYGSYPPYGNQPYNGGQPKKANTGVVIFSVVVMVCFSMLFGIIALMMAMKAPNEPTEELVDKKNKTAIAVGVIGIVVGIVSGVLYFMMLLSGAIY